MKTYCNVLSAVLCCPVLFSFYPYEDILRNVWVFFFVHTMNVIGIGWGLNPNVLQNNFCRRRNSYRLRMTWGWLRIFILWLNISLNKIYCPLKITLLSGRKS